MTLTVEDDFREFVVACWPDLESAALLVTLDPERARGGHRGSPRRPAPEMAGGPQGGGARRDGPERRADRSRRRDDDATAGRPVRPWRPVSGGSPVGRTDPPAPVKRRTSRRTPWSTPSSRCCGRRPRSSVPWWRDARYGGWRRRTSPGRWALRSGPFGTPQTSLHGRLAAAHDAARKRERPPSGRVGPRARRRGGRRGSPPGGLRPPGPRRPGLGAQPRGPAPLAARCRRRGGRPGRWRRLVAPARRGGGPRRRFRGRDTARPRRPELVRHEHLAPAWCAGERPRRPGARHRPHRERVAVAVGGRRGRPTPRRGRRAGLPAVGGQRPAGVARPPWRRRPNARGRPAHADHHRGGQGRRGPQPAAGLPRTRPVGIHPRRARAGPPCGRRRSPGSSGPLRPARSSATGSSCL